jgi:hypothetical protein
MLNILSWSFLILVKQAGMFAIRARRKVASERDFLDAVEKVVRQGTKFSSTYVSLFFFFLFETLTIYWLIQALVSSIQLDLPSLHIIILLSRKVSTGLNSLKTPIVKPNYLFFSTFHRL